MSIVSSLIFSSLKHDPTFTELKEGNGFIFFDALYDFIFDRRMFMGSLGE
jgi:hypothetical protein